VTGEAWGGSNSRRQRGPNATDAGRWPWADRGRRRKTREETGAHGFGGFFGVGSFQIFEEYSLFWNHSAPIFSNQTRVKWNGAAPFYQTPEPNAT
jgi:hypothetical protein